MQNELNFPPPKPKIEGNRIWDVLGKRWLVYTPEEVVRQHLILYLNHHKGYPLHAMVAEKQITVHQVSKRFDLLVYRKSVPFILCECKAPQVTINQNVLDQVARYNMTMNVPILCMTNGRQHFLLSFEGNKTEWLTEIPAYDSNK